MSSLEDFLIAFVSLSFVLNCLFLALFCRKVIKLDKLGQNFGIKISKTVQIKRCLMVLNMFLFVLDIILSYTDSQYWLNQFADFSLINLFYLINFTMQIYIVTVQIKKCQQRSIILPIYWAISLLIGVIKVITVEILQPNVGIILQIFICLVDMALLLIDLVFEKRKPTLDLEFLRNQSQVNTWSMMDKSKRYLEYRNCSKNLYIQFNKQFQIIMRKDQMICQFKIAVYVDDQSTIITKNDQQFIKLSEDMSKAFPGCAEVELPRPNIKFENMMKYGEEKQKIYESYLIDITKTDKYYTVDLLQFLEISPNKRNAIINAEKIKYAHKLTGSDEDQKYRTPFFSVSCNRGRIIVSNPEILELIINKSTEQILSFHHKLVDEKRLSLQILPQNPSNEEIIHFIELVVNKKSLWKSFASWFMLGPVLTDKIYNFFDIWNIGFNHIRMDIIGHEIAFDKQGRIQTLYLLSISKKKKDSYQESNERSILKKRYTDFFNLDKHVRRFLETNFIKNISLPSLPPKFSPFGSKTSPKSRQVHFDIYIKQLIRIQRISNY